MRYRPYKALQPDPVASPAAILIAGSSAVASKRDPLACAAQYVRMSTDHQQYSIANQQDAIGRYAEEHGLTIVQTYADEGRSGLSLDGRAGLTRLLDDVASGRADYRTILVYDVSRWGRFQDCDESACYEFLCRRAGIRVEYCTEPFRNDGSPMAAVVKSLKRVMAGEYSRELSAKVYAAKCRVTRRGFRVGGAAPYGTRRMAVDQNGKPRGILEAGEHKFLQTDRVVLVAGPENEIRVVRWIFRQICRGERFTAIARDLNGQGIAPAPGRCWRSTRIGELVEDESYIGTLTFGRSAQTLKTRKVHRPRDQWIRVERAFAPIIPIALFRRAQAALSRWSTRLNNEQALALLRDLLDREGRLSAELLRTTPGMPSSEFYIARFGGLLRAYQLIGYRLSRPRHYPNGYGQRRQRASELRQTVVARLREQGMKASFQPPTVVLVNDLRVSVVLCTPLLRRGVMRWCVQFHDPIRPHWVIAACLDADAETIRDYWLISATAGFTIGVKARKARERYQADTLETLLPKLMEIARQP